MRHCIASCSFVLARVLLRNSHGRRVPRWYGEKMRRKIQAGAGVENLRLRCPYFYDVALALHATDGAPSVADLVISTFRSRYKVRLIAFVNSFLGVCSAVNCTTSINVGHFKV